MKIALSSQWNIPTFNSKKLTSSQKVEDATNFNVKNSAFSFENRAIFLSFGAIQKINRPQNDADIKAFSEYLENKIELSLKVKDEEDIQNIIDSVAEKTKADKDLVSETLGRLVQFSSYSQIPALSQELEERNIRDFYCIKDNVDSNHSFEFIRNKKLLKPKATLDTFVVDDYNLPYIQKFEDDNILLASKMGYLVSEGKLKFSILDGFSVNIDGKPMSYNLFGTDEDLEKITTKVVQEVQKTGKSLDDVLNANKIAIIKEYFLDKAPIEVIRNTELNDYSAKNIAEYMKPNYPTKDEIELLIKVASSFYSEKSGISINQVQKLICEYLDNVLHCYSSQSLNEEFKSMYSLIEQKVSDLGKTMEDVIYVIPDKKKSFKYITSQFAKVNRIPMDKVIHNNGYWDFPKEAVYVILDDFFGTGYSVMGQRFNYGKTLEKIDLLKNNGKNCNFIFVPVLCTDDANRYINGCIEDYKRQNKDFLLLKNETSFKNDLSKKLSDEEKKQLKNCFCDSGYGDIFSCAVFPYSAPDNNTDFSDIFASFFFPLEIEGGSLAERVENAMIDFIGHDEEIKEIVSSYSFDNE